MMHGMTRENMWCAHGFSEEIENRGAALKSIFAPAIGGGGFLEETFGHFLPKLVVQAPEVFVFQALDGLEFLKIEHDALLPRWIGA